MTNLQWVVKHNLAEVVADVIETALDDYEEENWEKLMAYKWLFSERKEDVQLSENNELNV